MAYDPVEIDRTDTFTNEGDHKLADDETCLNCKKDLSQSVQYVCLTLKTQRMPAPRYYYFHVGCGPKKAN